MEFRYTTKVAYFLLLVTLLLPFYFAIQTISSDESIIFVFGPWWFLLIEEAPSFMVNPFGLLIHIPFWGPGVYMAKIAYDTTKTQELATSEYAMKIGKVYVLQIVLMIFLSSLVISGWPPPVTIPFPIVGLLALMLTKVTVKERTEPWDEKTTDDLVFE